METTETITGIVQLEELKYTLTDESKLANGRYMIPQSTLIPPKCWGMIIQQKSFVCNGDGIKSVE